MKTPPLGSLDLDSPLPPSSKSGDQTPFTPRPIYNRFPLELFRPQYFPNRWDFNENDSSPENVRAETADKSLAAIATNPKNDSGEITSPQAPIAKEAREKKSLEAMVIDLIQKIEALIAQKEHEQRNGTLGLPLLDAIKAILDVYYNGGISTQLLNANVPQDAIHQIKMEIKKPENWQDQDSRDALKFRIRHIIFNFCQGL